MFSLSYSVYGDELSHRDGARKAPAAGPHVAGIAHSQALKAYNDLRPGGLIAQGFEPAVELLDAGDAHLSTIVDNADGFK
jgi:hypothetical protein